VEKGEEGRHGAITDVGGASGCAGWTCQWIEP